MVWDYGLISLGSNPSLAGVTVLHFWAWHFTLTVHPCPPMCINKWVPSNLKLEGGGGGSVASLKWTSFSTRKEQKKSWSFPATETRTTWPNADRIQYQIYWEELQWASISKLRGADSEKYSAGSFYFSYLSTYMICTWWYDILNHHFFCWGFSITTVLTHKLQHGITSLVLCYCRGSES